METKPPLLTEKEAARYLGMSIFTIRQRRLKGRPPVYFKVGRSVRYRQEDLESFLDSCRVSVDEMLERG